MSSVADAKRPCRSYLLAAVGVATLGLGGACGSSTRACKDATLLVTVDFDGATSHATDVNVVVTARGAAQTGPVETQNLRHMDGLLTGTIEVDFQTGYHPGEQVDVTVTAKTSSGMTVGIGTGTVRLAAGCGTLTIDLSGGGNDGGTAGSGGDAAGAGGGAGTSGAGTSGGADDGGTSGSAGTSGGAGDGGTSGSSGTSGNAGTSGGGPGGTGGAALPPPYQVVAGSGSACAFRPNGPLSCWGLNSFGQIGNSTTAGDTCLENGHNYSCRASATAVSGLSDVTAADVGGWHACAVKADGSLWCWGRNDKSQLGHSGSDATCTDPGDNTMAPCNPTPRQVAGFPSGTRIAQVAASAYHTCALSTSGDVYCWGQNIYGELGASPATTTASAAPLKVTGLSSAALEVKVTIDHALITCARLADTTVWCWGQNDWGALGRDPANDQAIGGHPYHLPQPVWDAQRAPLSGVTSLQVGPVSCALKSDGTVWCWGNNSLGTLAAGGPADTNVHAVPVHVVLALPSTLTAISLKDFTAVVLDGGGSVWGWGRNNYATIGDGTLAGDSNCGALCKSTPVKLMGLSNVASVALGEATGFAVKGDGTVWGWGYNGMATAGHTPGTAGDGPCGPNASNYICSLAPVRVQGLP